MERIERESSSSEWYNESPLYSLDPQLSPPFWSGYVTKALNKDLLQNMIVEKFVIASNKARFQKPNKGSKGRMITNSFKPSWS